MTSNLLASVARQQKQGCTCRLMGLFSYKHKNKVFRIAQETLNLTYSWKQSIPPEVLQLFGHFRNLETLNFVSVTSLGVIREQVWPGSVLWGQRVKKLKDSLVVARGICKKKVKFKEFNWNTAATRLTKVIGYGLWYRHSENLFVERWKKNENVVDVHITLASIYDKKEKSFLCIDFPFCCY